MSNIQLSVLPAELFRGLDNLTKLNLSGLFQGLIKLDELNICQDEISEFPSGLFQGLSNLAHFLIANKRALNFQSNLWDGLSLIYKDPDTYYTQARDDKKNHRRYREEAKNRQLISEISN